MKKRSFSPQISDNILERMKDIVYWEPGMTVNRFVEEAVEAKAKSYPDFPRRPESQLPPGKKVN